MCLFCKKKGYRNYPEMILTRSAYNAIYKL